MEGKYPISQVAKEQYLLRPICKQQQQTDVRILRPTYPISRNEYEHVLDLGPFLGGPSFGAPYFRKDKFDSPTVPRPDLRKDDEDVDSSPEHQEYNSRVSLRTPPSNYLSPGSSSDNHRPPSWSRTPFKLDPFLAGSLPSLLSFAIPVEATYPCRVSHLPQACWSFCAVTTVITGPMTTDKNLVNTVVFGRKNVRSVIPVFVAFRLGSTAYTCPISLPNGWPTVRWTSFPHRLDPIQIPQAREELGVP